MTPFGYLAARIRATEDVAFGSGASEAEIEAAAHELGVPIVGSYRAFLRTFGWASLPYTEVYGLVEIDSDYRYLELVDVTKQERTQAYPLTPHHLLPVENNGAGDLYCLDTRVRGEPPVVFWGHERGDDQVPEHETDDFSTYVWETNDEKLAPVSAPFQPDDSTDAAAVYRGVHARLPAVCCQQLPGDPRRVDTGLWYFWLPGHKNERQLESSSCMCPFLIEQQLSDERFDATTVDEAIEKIVVDLQRR